MTGFPEGTEREDPYHLERFVVAQDRDDTYHKAVAELRQGRKTTHWMWFIFPQIAGLGFSATSQKFAISSLAEAKAYLQHRLLGPRLLECVTIVAQTQGRSAETIFGPVDAQKLHSSMTLFLRAAPGEPAFAQVIDHYFGGITDPATEQRL